MRLSTATALALLLVVSAQVQAGQAQTITVSPDSVFVDAGSFTITATSDSGLPVTITSVTSSLGTYAMGTGLFTFDNNPSDTGTIDVEAEQAGDATFDPADVSVTINVIRRPHTITLDVTEATIGDAPVTITATSDASGVIVSIIDVVDGAAQFSPGATNNTGTITFGSIPGTILIRVDTIDDVYDDTPQFVEIDLKATSQTIDFPQPPTIYYAPRTFIPYATAPGGLVDFSVVSGPAVVDFGFVVRVTGPGQIVLRAEQGGNAVYPPAPPVERTVTVLGNTQPFTYDSGADTDDNVRSVNDFIPAPRAGIVDAAGNVYVTGYQGPACGCTRDIVTVKFTPQGQIAWAAVYDGTSALFDSGIAVALDSAGNVCVIGIVENDSNSSPGDFEDDIFVAKYNGATGVPIFEIEYDGGGILGEYDEPTALAVNAAGDIFVTGYINDGFASAGDLVLIKFNGTTGADIWTRTVNGTADNFETGNAVALDSTGNVIVAGSLDNFDTDNDAYVAKYTTDGNLLWARSFDGTNNIEFDFFDTFNALAIDDAGNVYAAGEFETFQGNAAVLLKLNPAGVEQFRSVEAVIGRGFEAAFGITLDTAGGIYITGASNDNGVLTRKFAKSGAIVWTSRVIVEGNPDVQSVGHTVAVDAAGNVFVGGISAGIFSLSFHSFIQKLDSSGTFQWGSQVIGDFITTPIFPQSDGYAGIGFDAAGTPHLITGVTTDTGADIKVFKFLPLDNTIDFTQPADAAPGDTVALTATATSGETPAFLVVSGPAKLIPPNSIVTTGTGPVTVRATAAGIGIYKTAAPVERTFAVATAVTLTSDPVAVPNPATTGTAVQFLAAASGTDLTYAWDFGDGGSGTGVSPSHTYTAVGTYAVKVTVTGAGGKTAAGAVSVVVNAPGGGGGGTPEPGDTDGDGFSDEFETTAGSSTTDPTSTPNGASAAAAQPLPDVKMSIKLNFAKNNSDSILVAGNVVLDETVNLVGATVVISVGNVVRSYALSAVKSIKAGTDSLKFSEKVGVGNVRIAKFSWAITKRQFTDKFVGFGLENITTKTRALTIPVSVLIGSKYYTKKHAVTYTATAGKSGATKDKKN